MDDEASWRRLGAQVLWYRRDNLASNLKLLAVSQLLLSGTYAVGPRSLHCGGFGVLCGCGALIGLAAAHSWSRPLLYLHACTSLVTAGGAAQLLRKISHLLSSDLAERLLSSGATVHGLLSLRAAPGAILGQHHGTHSSHRLLLGLGGVTVLVCLLTVLAALTSLRLLCLPASWQSGADESRGMLLPTQIDRQGRELLDLDLAEAPELPVSELEEPLHLSRCSCDQCAEDRPLRGARRDR